MVSGSSPDDEEGDLSAVAPAALGFAGAAPLLEKV